jgi:DNA mismatch repair protein MutL
MVDRMSEDTNHTDYIDRVRVLDQQVSQQVAAGEVVDRPASVIKELVENALDAGASSIAIETSDAGSTRIVVSDDGRGMGREDAETAVLAHATSKIASIADLESVSTLGFRGEALPSIASVSSFELTTSTGEGAATKVSVEGGAGAEISSASRPRGTTVSAQRLFYNVPARREFLKSKKVERAAITETVTHLSMAIEICPLTATRTAR